MRKALITVAVLAAIFAVTVVGVLFFLPSRVAGDIATLLSERIGHEVEVGDLRWSFTPRLQLVGRRISVAGSEHGDRPLIGIGVFTLDARLWDLLATPRRIRSVHMTELEVHVPRGRQGSDSTDEAGEGLEEGTPAGSVPRQIDVPSTIDAETGPSTPLIVDRVVAERARLEIARSQPKPPRVFEIQSLMLGSVALDRPISFEASLTNPKPVGQVATTGAFGPWNKDEVRNTPISGRYEFNDADLAVFNGIGGILASTGTFGGTLGNIQVRGEADIPGFNVSVGQIVPLQTSFEVEVGDRGGDVQLRSVHTRFFQSELVAVGEVVRVEGRGGRSVVVDVTSQEARVEDLIRFGLKSDTPPLTGPIDLRIRLEIPSGERPVIERMQVTGEFAIPEARFTSLDVQKTLTKISRIGRGETEGESGSSVVSDLRGTFEIEDAELRFSRLTFAVPGMEVQLVGSFGLREQSLDFGGQLQLDQSVSELVPPGRLRDRAARWLRLLDPLFQPDEEETGTVVPITISGSRSRPSFGVELTELKPDWRRLLERPSITGSR